MKAALACCNDEIEEDKRMREFKNNLIALFGGCVIVAVIGLFIPSMREMLWGTLELVGMVIQKAFLGDIVRNLIILGVIAAIGVALCLTKKEQNKLWIILTGVVELIATILMFF